MEITWYGYSCLRLAERGSAAVVTDPYDPRQTGRGALKLAADIVTFSNLPFSGNSDKDHPAIPEGTEYNYLESIQGTPHVITGPGEYEVGGVFITGIQTGGHKGSEGNNTLYVFDFDTLTVAHLGDLSRVPTQAEIEAIGTVNIALVPIGSSRSLSATRMAEVLSQLEPNIVIPMHYTSPEPLNKFLKEMGLSDVETQPSLKMTKSALPEETKVILIANQRG
jgi:L-ascorbate metabolism protein UlaG (beta-lactamase superfamily)